jgi:hypothetical protein
VTSLFQKYPALCSSQQVLILLKISKNHLNTISEIILCCRKLLKEILKKEGKSHKDIFGKDTVPQVREHLSYQGR